MRQVSWWASGSRRRVRAGMTPSKRGRALAATPIMITGNPMIVGLGGLAHPCRARADDPAQLVIDSIQQGALFIKALRLHIDAPGNGRGFDGVLAAILAVVEALADQEIGVTQISRQRGCGSPQIMRREMVHAEIVEDACPGV